MIKKCLDCGTLFEGRSDKKFCCDYCRSNFHNHRNKTVNSFIRHTNHLLRKNRAILESLAARGKDKISMSWLIRQGFNFDFFTNVLSGDDGILYYFCYDHGYQVLEEEDLVLIVQYEQIDE